MALLGNYCLVLVQSFEAQQIPRVICHNGEWEKDSQTKTRRERDRERCMCHFTHRIESVAINFLVANLGALDGVVEFSTEPSDNSSNLGISMEDYIKHWGASAYCRYNSFSLSIFRNWKFSLIRIIKKYNLSKLKIRFSCGITISIAFLLSTTIFASGT